MQALPSNAGMLCCSYKHKSKLITGFNDIFSNETIINATFSTLLERHICFCCSKVKHETMTLKSIILILNDLVQDKVELSIGLLHLVALIQAEEGTAQQMLWIVHDDLEKVRNVISLIIKFWNF